MYLNIVWPFVCFQLHHLHIHSSWSGLTSCNNRGLAVRRSGRKWFTLLEMGVGDFHAGQKSRRRQKHAGTKISCIHYHADHKHAKTKSRSSAIPSLPKSRKSKITLKSRKFGFHRKEIENGRGGSFVVSIGSTLVFSLFSSRGLRVQDTCVLSGRGWFLQTCQKNRSCCKSVACRSFFFLFFFCGVSRPVLSLEDVLAVRWTFDQVLLATLGFIALCSVTLCSITFMDSNVDFMYFNQVFRIHQLLQGK